MRIAPGQQARDRAAEANNGAEIEYHIPKEGALMWFDQMAIPADAKNVAEAHEFLNYIMKPEVAAKATNYVQYANANLVKTDFFEAKPSAYTKAGALTDDL